MDRPLTLQPHRILSIPSSFAKGIVPKRRAPTKALVDFTRGLAVMVSGRLSISQALETSTAQCGNRRLREALVDVSANVNRGRSLSSSFERHSDVFDGLYVQLVRVGEAAGALQEMLLRLAAYLEKSASLRRKVRLALVYPCVVLVVACAAIVFLLTVIVPTFAEMFADFGAQLPAPTRLVVQISNLVSSHFAVFLAMIGTLAAALRYWLGSPKGTALRERVIFRIPYVGGLKRKSLTARFCRTLATLLGGGVSLTDALGILARTSDSPLLEQSVRILLQRVSRGERLTHGMDESRIFPSMLVQMIAVGEKTACLDVMLLHVACHYEEEVDATVDSLTSVIEPVLIVVLGVILGSILVAMYLPMFDLLDVVR